MITALDTNIPSALWSGQPFAAGVAASLARAGQEGSLVVCGVVYVALPVNGPPATQSYRPTS